MPAPQVHLFPASHPMAATLLTTPTASVKQPVSEREHLTGGEHMPGRWGPAQP